ncbi:hypothetical protein [Lolliginicoccus levis]|uniref:hypothetical protein n=1 Tax=Lolliginicoccus levis TaxID=2919542 RepID=UPI00241CA6DD|nr:hypothetical protein [Lolliginicoccus levis]
MATEIWVATIGGVAGAVSGGIASLLAPWAQWGVKKKQLRHERRVQRIAEWREGIKELQKEELQRHPPRSVVEKSRSIDTTGLTLPPLAKLTTRHWFLTLRAGMSNSSLSELNELFDTPLKDRVGLVPSFLATEVARIERDWDLV